MSEQMTPSRWPLYLALVAIAAAFAWVFMISVEQAKSDRSAELTLEMGNAFPGSSDLQITPKLGTLPPNSTAGRRLPQPAPWWPALLFGLAFLAGWLYRHGTRHSLRQHVTVTTEDANDELEDVQEQVVDVTNTSGQPAAYTPVAGGTPDLATDFPWDETLLDDTQGLTSEEQIARLEKKNASKAEIIKALELLVAENREKWLHQDETESRLNSHIQTLSDDLRVAIRQLQRLQTDSPSATGTHKKVVKSEP